MTSSNTKTEHFPAVFDEKTAEQAFLYLQNNVEWEDSNYSKRQKQVSRKGYSCSENNEIEEYVRQLVDVALKKVIDKDYIILGNYLNYYRDGNDFCPAHSHPGTVQLIISFGVTRKLTVGKKEFEMKSGDAIIFGSSTHKIDKDLAIKEGRISIAVFMKKLSDVIDLNNLSIT